MLIQEYKIEALTDLWTGSVEIEERNGELKTKIVPDRLINTGLLGSIRWWFEVLVRGLGGSVCDPTGTKCEGEKHCVVCELFGCTGWARKFRFEVLDKDNKINTAQINKSETFSLRFTPLRHIREEEWILLDATIKLIAEYGAMGGKTVFKPTDEQDKREKRHHKDYGLIEITKAPEIKKYLRLETYVADKKWRTIEEKETKDYVWASLQNFWSVNGMTLSRESASKSSFNAVLGRKESKACQDCRDIHNPPEKCRKTNKYPKRWSEQLVDKNDKITEWLAGSQQESKKVFSFKNPSRTFGFVKPGLINFDEMKTRLENVLRKEGWEFIKGDEIMKRIFAGKEDRV